MAGARPEIPRPYCRTKDGSAEFSGLIARRRCPAHEQASRPKDSP